MVHGFPFGEGGGGGQQRASYLTTRLLGRAVRMCALPGPRPAHAHVVHTGEHCNALCSLH